MVFIQHSFDLNQVYAQYYTKARCFAAGLFFIDTLLAEAVCTQQFYIFKASKLNPAVSSFSSQIGLGANRV